MKLAAGGTRHESNRPYVAPFGTDATLRGNGFRLLLRPTSGPMNTSIGYDPLIRLQSPRPSLSSARNPCSSHSAFVTQNCSLSFIMSAKTAPPRKTICFRRGGSSIRILKFCIPDKLPDERSRGLAKKELDTPLTETYLQQGPLSSRAASFPFRVARASRGTSKSRQTIRYACKALNECRPPPVVSSGIAALTCLIS